MNNIYYVIMCITLTLCFGTGCLLFRHLTLPFRLVLAQVFISLIVEILSKNVFKTGNMLLFSIYILPEIWLYTMALGLLLSANNLKPFWMVCTLTTLIWIINGIAYRFHGFFNYAYLSGGLLLSGLCIILLMKHIRDGRIERETPGLLLLLTGLAVYYLCAVPIFSLIGIDDKDWLYKPIVAQIFNIHISLAAMRYVFILLAFVHLAYAHSKPQSILRDSQHERQ